MALGEQTARLLETPDHDLDSPDVEQNQNRLSFSDGKGTAQRGWHRRRWRNPSWRHLAAVALMAAVVCGAVGYALGLWTRSAGRTPRSGVAPIRIMVAGDSISRGSEGMHTWRYRLWEWFHAEEVQVAFVGPFHRTRLQPEDLTPGVPLPPAHSGDGLDDAIDSGYALDVDLEFLRTGSAHFAIWGREVSQDLDVVTQEIRDYHPDYLLIELGFNDLTWGSRQPDELLHFMEQFITKSRDASPELRFAVANVPQKAKFEDLDIRTTQYNKLLREAIPKWSRPDSPVELVEFMETYSCGPNTCTGSVDGIHPNGQGEFEIAHAFSSTLHQKFGMGKQALGLPTEFPTRACDTPASVVVYPKSKDHPTRFAWDWVYGAGGYDFQFRQGGAEWVADSNFTKDRHLDTEWTTKGTWEFRVRTNCEMDIRSPWTDAVSTAVQ